jgi:hypothetical protein
MNISLILIKLAAKLKNLSDEQLALIEQGQFKIVFPTDEPTFSHPKPGPKIDANNLNDVVNRLKESKSRDESEEILGSRKLSKSDLTWVGDQLDIKLKNKDTKDTMVKMLIQNTIGFKLDTDVVAGTKSN